MQKIVKEKNQESKKKKRSTISVKNSEKIVKGKHAEKQKRKRQKERKEKEIRDTKSGVDPKIYHK